MKKITLFISVFILTVICSLKAQVSSSRPNSGLSHQMSEEEKLRIHEIGQGFSSSAPPVAPVRSIAEFEPTEAIIISYASGFGIPYSLIKDLSNDIKLIIVVSSQSQATSVTSTLQSNGVNTANCQFLIAPVDSWWSRDYTGWFIADGNNKVGIVDFKYDRPRANDDAIPGKQATFLNLPLYSMNLVQTGGNYMSDGMGIASATDLVWDDNSGTSQAQVKQLMKDYLGITNYMVVNDAQGEYIKHIDCWGKFLAVDKVLVDSVPSSDPRFNAYQAAAAYYRNTNCSYGYKYKVYRPFISSSANGEPYSNSLICNDKVYLAFKGTSNDNACLNLYKKAMPGYTIKGYMAGSAVWYPTDALHCRTHEIADRKMLYIHHMPLFGKVCSSTGYKLTVDAVSYAGQSIKSGYPMVKYKINNSSSWDSVSMALVSGNKYEATIPTQSNGTAIQYYIRAIDNSNKVAHHPFIGAPDPHTFIAECVTDVPTQPESETYFSTYPNPNNGNFFTYINSNKSCNANIKISNALGEPVYNETYDLNSGISLKNIQLNNISKGIYVIEFKTDFETITRKIVIQ